MRDKSSRENRSRQNQKSQSPNTNIPYSELDRFLMKEEQKNKNNRRKNRPIVFMTYLMVLVFLSMSGYLIYFVAHDSEKTIANSANVRQDAFEKQVTRGKILSSDGQVLAETVTDDEGNEKRNYPFSEVFAHAVGYNEYGRSGLELQENFNLVRSHQNIVTQLKDDLADNKNLGDNVVTTFDANLQKVAYDALGEADGAVVVIEPSTGKIKAMVSKPSFDPNNIEAVWESVHSEDGTDSSVLLNRATQGLYAPGSTFKIATTLEFIKEHPDYENYSYECEGESVFNNISIRCSRSKVHGEENLEDSFANSCNTSFANIGTKYLNMDGLSKTCNELLYNQELPYEDGSYNKSEFVLNGQSPDYEIPQTVIGQGDTLITPLHNAMIMCALANGGTLMKPYMVDSIENSDGGLVKQYEPKTYKELIDPSNVEKMTPLLTSVCTRGTASGVFGDKSYTMAGKTGTAEVDEEGTLNSWFVGYSNVENPDLVVSVVVERYNENGVYAASVAAEIYDAYYNK